MCTRVSREEDGPTEDEKGSRIFSGDLGTGLGGGRKGREEVEGMRRQGQDLEGAHPRDMCARKTDGRLRPFWYEASSHESSASASSERAPTQIA